MAEKSKTMTWMQTANSRKLDLMRPDLTEVDWFEVARSLSRIARFNGHAAKNTKSSTYSVAQHCCLVHDNLPEKYKLAGLLHDAHEYAIGDQTTPFKNALRDEAEAVAPGAGAIVRQALRNMTAKHDAVLFAAAGCAYPMSHECEQMVKLADIRAMMTERRDLFNAPSPEPWGDYEGYALFPEPITPWTSSRAVFEFLDRLHALTGKAYKLHQWEGGE